MRTKHFSCLCVVVCCFLIGSASAVDFGDAPLPYPTTLIEDGARHEATGPRLGDKRDSESDGTHSAAADADDTTYIDDEDGASFGTIQVGRLGASVTVDVQNAPGGARLDAWIDFNGDGCWGGPFEQIADNVIVADGNNIILFDVPSWAVDGPSYARFRLSTAGDLAPGGSAADGEVEDCQVTITAPVISSGVFGDLNVITTDVNFVKSVFAADVDGDGDMDVLSASGVDNTIAWYENDPNQNFTPHIITMAANGAESVFAADVDGDGDMDVLSASQWGHTIAWYENYGSENFTAHTIAEDVNGACSVFAADVDGDGDLDVLSACRMDDKIDWYDNNGSENFTPHTITPDAFGAQSVFAADLDGDGDMDVLSASTYDDKIAWYENYGSENFTDHNIATDANGATSVFAADVDGDGDLDVLSSSQWDGTIAWYDNNGSENFTPHIITTDAYGAESVFAADVDGDGDMDVLSASMFDDKIAWYDNDGSENFTAHIITTDANGASSVFAADMDGDGDLDVLSASFPDAKIAWYENLGFDFGDAPAPYPTTLSEDGARHRPTGPRLGDERDAESDGIHSVAADADDTNDIDDEDGVSFGTIQAGRLGASVTVNVQNYDPNAKLDAWVDFNGDGCWGGSFEQIADNVTVADGNNSIIFDVPSWAISGQSYARFRLSTAGDLAPGGLADDGEVEDYEVTITAPAAASGIFGEPNVITTDAYGAYSVFAADVDGDGDLDALSASLYDNKIAWYENDGSGNFTPHTITADLYVAVSVFAADVDGDGDMDVLSASKDNRIAWYENVGGGNFTAYTITLAANGAESVFAADVDGDGDMDVLSASYWDNKIAWYANDGSESFTAHTITTAAYRAVSVFASDVDGDGDMDVLSASYNDKIAWYENNGSEGFTDHNIATDVSAARSVSAADVDGDGDMDVLSASENAGIVWYANDGNESFTDHNIGDGGWSASVFAGDVDGDGDMDVLSTSSAAVIAWYENDGSQNFTPHTVTTYAGNANSVFAGDVDGDGDLDVLSACGGDNTIAWYENSNCVVDCEDLGYFVNQWLVSGDVEANFDWDDIPVPDNRVDLYDFSYLAYYWMTWCPEDWPWE